MILPPVGPYTITISGYPPNTKQDQVDRKIQKSTGGFTSSNADFSQQLYTLVLQSKEEAQALVGVSGVFCNDQRLTIKCREAQGVSGGVGEQVGGPQLPTHLKTMLTALLKASYMAQQHTLWAHDLANR